MPVTIRLRDFMEGDDGWGHSEGRRVHEQLLKVVEQHPSVSVFCISLDGVRRTDASFPRESVVELARRLRGQKGLCLVDVSDPDVLDNWDAAARRKDQPMIVWLEAHKYQVLGNQPSEGNRPLFEIIASSNGITTSEIASQLSQGISNVSNKTRSLWDSGYIQRRERIAPSGGIEFEYYIAK